MSSTATHRKQHGQTIMVGVRITLALNHYNLVLLCCQVLDSYFEIVGRSNCVGESVGHLLAWCAGLVQHGTAWNSMGILTCFTLVAQLLQFIKKSVFFSVSCNAAPTLSESSNVNSKAWSLQVVSSLGPYYLSLRLQAQSRSCTVGSSWAACALTGQA